MFHYHRLKIHIYIYVTYVCVCMANSVLTTHSLSKILYKKTYVCVQMSYKRDIIVVHTII